MSDLAYVTGMALVAVTLAAAGVAGWWLRRLLLPAWAGAPARLAETVLAAADLMLVGEAMGSVGEFRRVWLVCGAGATALVAFAAGRRRVVPRPPAPAPASRRWEPALAAAVWVALMAEWGARAAVSFGRGIVEADTVAYHLPFALQFAQSGWVTRIPRLTPDLPTDFFPANAELFHAVGIALTGRDFLSPAINLLWLSATLLAAWCVGQRFGRGAAAVVAVGAVLALPLFASSQGGSAQNDVVTVFFLLAAAALFLHADGDRGGLLVSGLAVGMAAGTKYTMVAPAGALLVGVWALAGRGRRVRSAVAFVSAALVGGGFWYVRNAVLVGSPLPTMKLGVGPLALPRTPVADLRYYYSVAHYATSVTVLRTVVRTGLSQAMGHAWPLVLALAVLGVALALTAEPPVRVLAAVAAVAAVTYVVTPSTALGPAGHPIQQFVTANLRYLFPGLALAFALIPAAPVVRARVPAPALDAGLVAGAGAIVVGVGGIGVWLPSDRRVAVVVAAAAAVALLAVRAARAARARIAVGAVLVVAVVAALLPVGQRYLRREYRSDPWGMAPAWTWARTVGASRIGIDGFYAHYPLSGPALSNRVVFVGATGSHDALTETGSCASWRKAVDAAAIRYLVVAPAEPWLPVPPQRGWTAADPHAVPVLRTGGLAVFRIDGSLDPSTCPQLVASQGPSSKGRPPT